MVTECCYVQKNDQATEHTVQRKVPGVKFQIFVYVIKYHTSVQNKKVEFV